VLNTSIETFTEQWKQYVEKARTSTLP
jgi:hypothetical protein